jgi:hypothetical protein
MIRGLLQKAVTPFTLADPGREVRPNVSSARREAILCDPISAESPKADVVDKNTREIPGRKKCSVEIHVLAPSDLETSEFAAWYALPLDVGAQLHHGEEANDDDRQPVVANVLPRVAGLAVVANAFGPRSKSPRTATRLI